MDLPGLDGDNTAIASTSSAGRRSSTRSIKRKKFDDEVVESSLLKTERIRLRPSQSLTDKISIVPASSGVNIGAEDQNVDISAVVSSQLGQPAASTSSVAAASEKRRLSRSKRGKKTKSVPGGSCSSRGGGLGRWKAQDDLALILAVQQTCDLSAVHVAVKFSCHFTLNDIKERWHSLLYDQDISSTSVAAIRQLHPDVVASIESKTLFSKEEENLLSGITSTSQPTLETFDQLLASNRLTFLPRRTAKSLQSHWLLLKQYHLLPDQSVQPMPRGDHVLNFSDAEDMIDDQELLSSRRDEEVEQELLVADRRQKKEIRRLEEELPKWQVLVDSVTGVSPPEFDNLTLAVLRGRLVRYLMRSRCITIGRAAKRSRSGQNHVDVDLSLEGPAWKISRRQGHIKLAESSGDFYIYNVGRRPIFVDGRPVSRGSRHVLHNNSVIEITCLRFIFLINTELIAALRNHDSSKNSAATAASSSQQKPNSTE